MKKIMLLLGPLKAPTSGILVLYPLLLAACATNQVPGYEPNWQIVVSPTHSEPFSELAASAGDIVPLVDSRTILAVIRQNRADPGLSLGGKVKNHTRIVAASLLGLYLVKDLTEDDDDSPAPACPAPPVLIASSC